MKIGKKTISKDKPTYFIADIAANHDGSLQKAKELIYLAAEAGADAAKFQHFKAESIVSKEGFANLGLNLSHQKTWQKSVFDVYKDASVDINWTNELSITCADAGIEFMTTPYNLEVIEEIDPYVPAYKIGSGDITWFDLIDSVSNKDKPIILAAGASTMDEVVAAVNRIQAKNRNLVLMQCNTNYTASLENFKYIKLNVLKSFKECFPKVILGLSDHTPGHTTVLGAIALGAKVIEKHFTDSNELNGPDHKFSMNPNSWKEMVDRSRELELALGTDSIKQVENNEKETVIVQRRAIYIKKEIKSGDIISEKDLMYLRPCPIYGIPPTKKHIVLNKEAKRDLSKGSILTYSDVI